MKKKKLNLSKLFLNKDVISHLSQEKILGGAATVLEQTCRRSCYASCIACVTKDVSCVVTSC
ncbi:class I lanthipeptide [Chitinophaga qingshengii]|uniref:Class I lanthipeptide n=1 Tax=Chitinophaga qingshengii TaxID=1569794 RepID=A0ABR7TV78_9BACT|nr:class I lanthipeptide [Chitinophaga qingshengii]MBC9933523.1 class I lanthipeptide [Chitinophaga qingshengii]